jgi:hypothetical protein
MVVLYLHVDMCDHVRLHGLYLLSRAHRHIAQAVKQPESPSFETTSEPLRRCSGIYETSERSEQQSSNLNAAHTHFIAVTAPAINVVGTRKDRERWCAEHTVRSSWHAKLVCSEEFCVNISAAASCKSQGLVRKEEPVHTHTLAALHVRNTGRL